MRCSSIYRTISRRGLVHGVGLTLLGLPALPACCNTQFHVPRTPWRFAAESVSSGGSAVGSASHASGESPDP